MLLELPHSSLPSTVTVALQVPVVDAEVSTSAVQLSLAPVASRAALCAAASVE